MALSVELDSVRVSAPAGSSSPSNVELGYTDAQIQRAVCYTFAILAGLGSAGISAVS